MQNFNVIEWKFVIDKQILQQIDRTFIKLTLTFPILQNPLYVSGES